jgi:hypothetical protein
MMKRFEAPEYVEVKMDAEIGSYQEDQDPSRRDPYFVAEEKSEG